MSSMFLLLATYGSMEVQVMYHFYIFDVGPLSWVHDVNLGKYKSWLMIAVEESYVSPRYLSQPCIFSMKYCMYYTSLYIFSKVNQSHGS